MRKTVQSTALLLMVMFLFSACSEAESKLSFKKVAEKLKTQPEAELIVADAFVETLEKEIPNAAAPSRIQVTPDPFKGWRDTEPVPPEVVVTIETWPTPQPLPEPPPGIPNSNSEDLIFDVAALDPEYPGGSNEMRMFIVENMRYPEIDRELGTQGRVYIQFVVEKDGSLSNIEVARGVSSTLDEEAIRIVASMPKWKPGESDGEIVRCRVRLPVTFTLM